MSSINDSALNFFYQQAAKAKSLDAAAAVPTNPVSNRVKRPALAASSPPAQSYSENPNNKRPRAVACTNTDNERPARPVKQHKPNNAPAISTAKPQPFRAPKPRSVDTDNSAIFSDATFQSLPLARRLIEAIHQRLHLTKPTVIQCQSIPLLVEGNDALIQSNTGTGKTLCYLLPVIEMLTRLSQVNPIDRTSGVMALILVPTRELVMQIQGQLSLLLQSYHWIVSGCLMGGENKTHEKSRLRKGMNIIVATPGRLVDHINTTTSLDFTKLKFLIFDEADRLLEMGFEKDIESILARINASGSDSGGGGKRQNVLVSATMNAGIEELARLTLNQPVYIGKGLTHAHSIAGTHSGSSSSEVDVDSVGVSLPSTLKHYYLEVETRHRLVALAAFLKHQLLASQKCKMIVFFSTCASVQFHHALLTQTRWPPGASEADSDSKLIEAPIHALHGSMNQKNRTLTFQSFAHCDSSAVLFCTDVASRGLDLPLIDYVLQYDIGEQVTDYIHRVGRSARIGHSGTACTFVTSHERPFIDLLAQETKLEFSPLMLAKIFASLRVGLSDTGSGTDRELPAGLRLQRHYESMLGRSAALMDSAVSAYQAYLRAYAAYPKALKHIFHPRFLHLGHVCRSFALIEEPKKVGAKATQLRRIGNAQEASERGNATSAGREVVDMATLFRKRGTASSTSEFAA